MASLGQSLKTIFHMHRPGVVVIAVSVVVMFGYMLGKDAALNANHQDRLAVSGVNP